MLKKRIIPLVLTVIMLLGLLPIGTLTAGAANLTEDEFAQRLKELKNEYPDGMYWTKTNGTDGQGISKAGPNTCTNHYAYSGTCGEYAGVGWQCFGFANVIAMKLFGTFATKFSDAHYLGSGWTYNRSVDRYYAGDYVRLYGTGSGHSVFITKVEGDKISIVDCNRSGLCQIDWDMTYDRSYIDTNAVYVLRYSGNTLTGTGTPSPELSVKYDANGGTVTRSTHYIVGTSVGLNVRSEPTTASNILTALPYGTEINVLETVEAAGYLWGKINTSAGMGWCAVYDYSSSEYYAVYNGYHADGAVIKKGSSDFVQTMQYGTAAYDLMTPEGFGLTREGYVFSGWSDKPSDGTVYAPSQNVTAETLLANGDGQNKSITLYARWRSEKPDLEVYEMPEKTVYLQGEPLDTNGLKLRLVYHNGDTTVLGEGFTVSGYEPDTVGIQKLTVEYDGLTAEFSVEVKAYDAKAVLKGTVARYGEKVDVFLSFDKELEVRAVGVNNVVFDVSKLELLGGEWLLDGGAINNWNINDDAGVFAYENDVKVKDDILRLTFKVLGDAWDGSAEISLDVTATRKGEGDTDVELYVEGGKYTVFPCTEVEGDVDRSGALNADDAIYLLYHVLFGSQEYPIAEEYDFDGNGSMTSDDAVYLLYHVLFGADEYPLDTSSMTG